MYEYEQMLSVCSQVCQYLEDVDVSRLARKSGERTHMHTPHS